MIVVDANVFIRALVGTVVPTDEPLVVAARGLFLAVAAGDEQISTNEAVIAEVVFILHSPRHIGLARQEVIRRLVPLLGQPGCHFADKNRVLRAFALWIAWPRVSFVDALTAAQALSTEQPLATFDEALAALPGLVRWQAAQS